MKRFLSMMLICFVAMSGFAENDVKGAFKTVFIENFTKS